MGSEFWGDHFKSINVYFISSGLASSWNCVEYCLAYMYILVLGFCLLLSYKKLVDVKKYELCIMVLVWNITERWLKQKQKMILLLNDWDG